MFPAQHLQNLFYILGIPFCVEGSFTRIPYSYRASQWPGTNELDITIWPLNGQNAGEVRKQGRDESFC